MMYNFVALSLFEDSIRYISNEDKYITFTATVKWALKIIYNLYNKNLTNNKKYYIIFI